MLLKAVVAAFVVTQVGYLVVNCGLVVLFARRPVDAVDERTLGRVLEGTVADPKRRPRRPRPRGGGDHSSSSSGDPTARPAPPVDHNFGPDCRLPARLRRRIHVFVPVAGDRWDSLEGTLASIAGQTYPASQVSVAVVYGLEDRAAVDPSDAVESGRANGLAVSLIGIDGEIVTDARVTDRRAGTGGGSGSRTEAAALSEALATRSFAADDIVTACVAGTRLPVDAFELAVVGLEEYDIVRAKRTAGNVHDGPVPLLESMGSAVRSDLPSTNAGSEPCRPLEEGTFATARVLNDLEGRRRDDATGATTRGGTEPRRNGAVGVLDRYLRTRCPTAIDAWVQQSRQQVRDSYRCPHAPDRSRSDRVRFVAGTAVMHLLAVTNVVGIPLAIAVLVSAALGWVSLAGPLGVLVACNAAVWAYYSVVAYRAARDAVPLEGWARLRYALVSSPLAHALYVTLWAVPIALALCDIVRGDEPPARPSVTER
ncbi:hypothetical protein [Natrinema versiforme]|uniref:hypothetical protein n=1 Tax=Natrinema versiforme TaxID=88724 RepID=UPI001586F738|nr:hypothetical protein [Natrinema versiforme]